MDVKQQTDVRLLLQPIFKNEFLIEQKLCEKAIKILLKFIETAAPAAASIRERKASEEAGEDQIYNRLNPVKVEYKFLSLAQVRHNFKAITSHETLLICGELERIGLLEGQLYLGKLRYKFNLDPAKAGINLVTPSNEVILAAQKRYLETINKKLLNAAKTIKRLQPTQREILNKLSKAEKDEGLYDLSEKDLKVLEKKTALELHQSKECDPLTCRFCQIEKKGDYSFR